jgi:hypothetical protein
MSRLVAPMQPATTEGVGRPDFCRVTSQSGCPVSAVPGTDASSSRALPYGLLAILFKTRYQFQGWVETRGPSRASRLASRTSKMLTLYRPPRGLEL